MCSTNYGMNIANRLSQTISDVTGNLLLDLMPVMFIPAAVGIIDKIEELKAVMIPMLIITFVTTFIVMSITGVTAEWIIKRQKKGEK